MGRVKREIATFETDTVKKANWQKSALNDFSKSLNLGKNNVTTLYHRGCLFKDLKEYKLALNDFNEGLRLQPNHVNLLYERASFFSDYEGPIFWQGGKNTATQDKEDAKFALTALQRDFKNLLDADKKQYQLDNDQFDKIEKYDAMEKKLK